MNIMCVQETKCKGAKAKEIGDGYKLFYSGVDNTRNFMTNLKLLIMVALQVVVLNDHYPWNINQEFIASCPPALKFHVTPM